MGNSLLEDAIGFFADNIEKAGQAFKESNERDRALIQSYRSGGTVDPQQRQGMLEEYIGHANPIGAVGGMIKPSTWAKYTPEAKARVTEVANRSPQKFKEVLDNPVDLWVRETSEMPSTIGGQYRAGLAPDRNHSMERIGDTINEGFPAQIKLRPGNDMRYRRVAEHELLHHLNDTDRIGKTDAEDAWTIARLVQSRLAPHERGSLDKILYESTEKQPGLWGELNTVPTTQRGWDARNLQPTRDFQWPHTYRISAAQAMDESLAHLGQAAAKPNASPEIRKLARDMGVSWEDKTKEVLFGGKDSPKWNPRDVPMPPASMLDRLNASRISVPRDPVTEGALNAFNALRRKLGLDARFRHGTDPKSAIGIIKEGLNPGSSVSKAGGRDFEGYPVTFEFDDSLKGAKAYDSPFGPTAHEGAARTGEAAKNIKRVFFDPDEFSYKEDALDIFRDLRKTLNESGRKDLKIERARWDDDAEKWRYGEKLSLKGMRSFNEHVRNAKNLDRLFNETMDNLDRVPEERAKIFRKRLDAILEEMARREGK